MADNPELLEMLSAILDAKKPKSKKPAPRPPAEPAEIAGVRIVDESTPRAPRAKKTVPAREPNPPPTPRGPGRPRKASVSPPPERAFPKPGKELTLKRSAARPMPHKCDCPLCPLKN